VAAIPVTLVLACGCTTWDRDRWNFDRYRDERAVDIDNRLDENKPIVENPF
jgi:hypothetical protein